MIASRRIGIRTSQGGIEIKHRRDETNGLALASAEDQCDLEIELSGITGHHVVRLNIVEPVLS